MADFYVAIYQNLEVVPWTDPRSVTRGDRLGQTTIPQRRVRRVAGQTIVRLAAILNGDTARVADAGLSSRLFSWGYGECPSGALSPTTTAGQSSLGVIEVGSPGHYVVLVTRPASGSVLFHFDVDPVGLP